MVVRSVSTTTTTMTECRHGLLDGTCSICLEPKKPTRSPTSQATRDALVPLELSFPVIAAHIERLAPEWVSVGELEAAVLRDPILGSRILEACAHHDTDRTPEDRAANVVAFFSKAWTEESNDYSPRFERRGGPGGYEYRQRPASVDR